MLGGRGGGIFTALGVVTGQAIWALATSAGIAALLLASEPAFQAVKILGAAYLVFLGAQALVGALRVGNWRHATPGVRPVQRLGAAAAYRQGVISNLGNPKMAAFFPSLLPQFAPGSEPSFFALLFLGAVFCTLTLAWLSAYAFAVAKAGDFFRRPKVRRIVESATGAVLIALGLRVAAAQR